MVHKSGLHSTPGFPCPCTPSEEVTSSKTSQRQPKHQVAQAWLHPAEGQMQGQEDFSWLPAGGLGQQ